MIANELKTNPRSTKESKDQNLEKNPDNGGIPASENKRRENRMQNHKFFDPKEFQLIKYFQRPSLGPATTKESIREKRQADIKEYKTM